MVESSSDKHNALLNLKESLNELNALTKEFPSLNIDEFNCIVKQISWGILASNSEKIADVLNTLVSLKEASKSQEKEYTKNLLKSIA